MEIIDEKLIGRVQAEAKASPRLRMNYNFHRSLDEKCHRFLNCMEPGTPIPVHHHPTRDETVVLLKGRVRVTTYDDAGRVLQRCVLCPEEGTYGANIPRNMWHGLECLAPSVLMECKEGPFIPHEADGILQLQP